MDTVAVAHKKEMYNGLREYQLPIAVCFFIVLGMDIQLRVDFDRQVLVGMCEFSVRNRTNAPYLILDVLALVCWLKSVL